MHKIPEPKSQSKLLKEYLSSVGLTLPHQKALEAISMVMGFKNWKTYSAAAVQAPKLPSTNPLGIEELSLQRPEVKNDEPEKQGTRYKVPVTVSVTDTAYLEVYADSAEDAIELALVLARDTYPLNFERDEGYNLKLEDFYCPDEDGVDECYSTSLTLTVAEFDRNTHDVENYSGTTGRFSVETHGGVYRIDASLSPDKPDCSDDDRRAECTLDVSLAYGLGHAQEGTVLLTVTQPYSYCGDDNRRGSHLLDLFYEGTLIEMLFESSKK